MGEWTLSGRDLKRYPHFDKMLDVAEATAIATNPERVRTHAFFPFICFEKNWTPFRNSHVKPRKKKVRPIRYAARGDSYIYSYYRHLLSERYEALLQAEGLVENVIAYRKIPVVSGGGGKCNIHFAKAAFDIIAAKGNCCAIALDISNFFESIDHARLKKVWCDLLGVKLLPADHYQVFVSITRYADVDRTLLYERLGYVKRDKAGILRFALLRKDMPYQLCTTAEFRNHVAQNEDDCPRLIRRNKESFGIPQGAPISDVLANAYLLDFDRKMLRYVRARDGAYFRYSDDILVVLPGDGRTGRAAREYAVKLISTFGAQLRIKPEKCSMVRFRKADDRQTCERLSEGKRRDGLEYLGFRFDGAKVYFRDSTLTNLKRKIKRAVRAQAYNLTARYPGKDADFIIAQFRTSRFLERFGRVQDFESSQEYRNQTFWSYALKARRILGPTGQPIFQQLKGYRTHIERLIAVEVPRAMAGISKHRASTQYRYRFRIKDHE